MDSQLIQVIEAVNLEAYNIFQTQLKSNILDRSFKKITISDVDFTGDIYKYILWYRSELSKSLNIFAHDISYMSTESFNISYRIKALNSIIYKIQRYKKLGSCEEGYGKFPLMKVLNDIAGFRIIMSNPPNATELSEYLNEIYQSKIKVINSDKDDYRAIHLYTTINNKMLPWELQIWNVQNEVSNVESHSKYKQDYVKWEEEQSDLKF